MKAMRREIEGTDVAAAPVVSEGGRSPSDAVHRFAGYDAEPFDDRAVRPASVGAWGASGRSCCA